MEQTKTIKRWQIVSKAQNYLAKTKLSYDTRKNMASIGNGFMTSVSKRM